MYQSSLGAYIKAIVIGIVFLGSFSIAHGDTVYTVTDIGELGSALNSEAFGVNESGDVVGYMIFNEFATHAFLYDGVAVHDLGTLGHSPSRAREINNAGAIVGSSHNMGNTAERAFLHDGSMHDLGTLGGTNSVAHGINNLGNIIGYADSPGGERAFFYNGTMHDLGTLGGSASYAMDINESNQIVGLSQVISSLPFVHAFIYNGTMIDLGTLGGSSSRANAINDEGTVVGSAQITGDVAEHAYYYDGSMHDMGTLGGSSSFAHGINSNGEIVGDSLITGDATSHAFLYKDGQMIDLNSLWPESSSSNYLYSAKDINSAGQIVGVGIKEGGIPYAFLMSPVVNDEPLVLTTFADSFLRNGNNDRNEGANPHLHIQSSGHNRAVVAFDETAIAAYVAENGISSATLVFTIADNGNNWGSEGRTVDAHPLLIAFEEGNGKNAGIPSSEFTRGEGAGVTWNCATDTAIENQATDCNPQWNGGLYGAATAPSVLHSNNQSGEVSWDVTADVLNGSFGWLIKKTDEGQNGKMEYYSKEGAATAENPQFAPRLILNP